MSLLNSAVLQAVVVAGLTFLSQRACAEIVTWEYRGLVTTIDNSEGWLTEAAMGGLSALPMLGSTWIARVTYDTATPDSSSDPTDGRYYNAILSAELTFGADTVPITTDGIGAPGRDGFENDSNSVRVDTQFRSYETQIIDVFPSRFSSSDFAFERFYLYLRRPLLGRDQILNAPPQLDSSGYGQLWWTYADEAFSGRFADELRGSVDSIRLIPTPLPAASWLLLSGLAALGVALRGGSRAQRAA